MVKGDKAEITLSTSFEGGAIFYTLDGSEPSFESALYDEPFTVSKTTGIRAVAYKEDFSELAEADPVFINIVPNYNLNVSVEGQGTVVKVLGEGIGGGPSLFFYQNAEGSSYNRFLEIRNPTDSDLDLSGYAFPNQNNGADSTESFDYWNSFPEGQRLLRVGIT